MSPLNLGLDDIIVADKPPTDRARATRGRDTSKKLREGIQGFYGLAGIGISIWCQECGSAILAGAEQRAIEWVHLAEQNPSVKRTLEAIISGSVWGEVVIGNIALLIPVFVHHGILPPQLLAAFAPQPSNGEVPHEHVSTDAFHADFVPPGAIPVS